MNCTEVRKYLYAFADGELDTQTNLDVLEHLNMCSSCTQKVNAQQKLKERVGVVMGDEKSPEALRSSLGAMIAREANESAGPLQASASAAVSASGK